MRIALVIGTRPQIIKSAPIIHRVKEFPEVDLRVIHTGQHYDFVLSKSFFNELSLPDPVVNLGVGSDSHAKQTAKMIVGLEETFLEEKPDIVLVPGDTNSTLAAALTAAKMHIPVAHVESGARSYDMQMPEEINRRLTDHCSDHLFAVSENCAENLRREGIPEDKISVVGDTMYESILTHRSDIERDDSLTKYGLEKKKYIILTVHRAENTDNLRKLEGIVEAVVSSELDIVYPCHPRTRAVLERTGLDMRLRSGRIKMMDPVPYYSMLNLIENASLVLTDSGGIQKEAYWLMTPCVTLRDTTEWTETLLAGANRLVSTDPRSIKKAIVETLNIYPEYRRHLSTPNASMSILEKLVKKYVFA